MQEVFCRDSQWTLTSGWMDGIVNRGCRWGQEKANVRGNAGAVCLVTG